MFRCCLKTVPLFQAKKKQTHFKIALTHATHHAHHPSNHVKSSSTVSCMLCVWVCVYVQPSTQCCDNFMFSFDFRSPPEGFLGAMENSNIFPVPTENRKTSTYTNHPPCERVGVWWKNIKSHIKSKTTPRSCTAPLILRWARAHTESCSF